MNLSEFANYLNITRATLYNWKENKENLYNIVMKEYEKINTKYKNIDKFDNTENIFLQNDKKEEIYNLLNELTEIEQDYFISLIKTRILKKKLGGE